MLKRFCQAWVFISNMQPVVAGIPDIIAVVQPGCVLQCTHNLRSAFRALNTGSHNKKKAVISE